MDLNLSILSTCSVCFNLAFIYNNIKVDTMEKQIAKRTFLQHLNEKHYYYKITKNDQLTPRNDIANYIFEYGNDIFRIVLFKSHDQIAVQANILTLPKTNNQFEVNVTEEAMPTNKQQKIIIRSPAGEEKIHYFHSVHNIRNSKVKVNVIPVQIDEAATAISTWDRRVLDILTCPVCTEYIRPPIYQCQNGHGVCARCHKQVEKCPMCKIVLGKKNIRNILMEQVSFETLYPCKYEKCPFRAKLAQLENHEKDCAMKSYKCNHQKCKGKTWNCLEDLYKHLHEMHPNVM